MSGEYSELIRLLFLESLDIDCESVHR